MKPKLLSLLLLLFVFACSSQRGTVKAPKNLKDIGKLYAFVPSGKVYLNYDKETKTWQEDSLSAFMILPTEITNFQYKEFLYSFKGNPSDSLKYVPDVKVWKEHLFYNQPYMDHYFFHPAYKDYPVLGVSKEQAEAYCAWLTEALKVTYPNHKIRARLPKKSEWLRAARGDARTAYPQSVGKKSSSPAFNYKVIDQWRIAHNDSTQRYEVVYHNDLDQYSNGIRLVDPFLITTIATAYWPNEFGVYNMSGNVAEMVSDEDVAMGGSWHSTGFDARLDAELPFTKPSSTVGFRPILEFLD